MELVELVIKHLNNAYAAAANGHKYEVRADDNSWRVWTTVLFKQLTGRVAVRYNNPNHFRAVHEKAREAGFTVAYARPDTAVFSKSK